MARFDRGCLVPFRASFLGTLFLVASTASGEEAASKEVASETSAASTSVASLTDDAVETSGALRAEISDGSEVATATNEGGDTLTVFRLEVNEKTDADAEDQAAPCEGEPCEDGVCEKDGCEDSDCAEGEQGACESAQEADAEDPDTESESQADAVVRPTHKQVKIIKVLTSDLPTRELKTFCISSGGELLAACAGDEAGDVRVFDPTGEFLGSWELPFEPDAINVGSDDRVYVAGEGKLARFTRDGELVNQGALPHAEALLANKDALREEVIESHAQQLESFTAYLDQIDEQIVQIEDRIAKAKEAEEAKESEAEEQEEASDADKAADALQQAMAWMTTSSEPKTNQDEAMLEAMKSSRDSIQEMVDDFGGEELTEEQIEERVNDSIAYKLKVASISEADGEVFVATGAEKGYGFCVWRTNRWFESGEKIVKGLSGCCGQMDVQACCDGVFVAENGRHKVQRYDRGGEKVGSWGSSARKGLEGFGGCCNPMNVAFGADGSVYTAESESGRIKRFTNEGELIDLVGKVDLVPGCKKVSIAVGPEGDRVYMLDITRNHIVMMERMEEDEQVAYFETKGDAPANSFFKQLLGLMVGE